MGLTARMAAHISQRRADRRQGRTKSVVFVSVGADGTRSYTVVAVNFRPVGEWDPSLTRQTDAGAAASLDVVMESPVSVDLTFVAYVADTATPTAEAVQPAPRFVIVERHTAGIVPGGDRWISRLRRVG